MKILHIVAGMPPESGVAAVVTRLAAEQVRLGCEVSVASTQEGKVAVGSRSGQLEGRTPRQGEADPEQNIEHRTSNIEHRTMEGEEVLKFESSKVLKCEEVLKLEGVRGVTFRRSRPHFLYFSWGMLLGLGKLVKEAEVVHVHSNWTFPVWWGAWLALRHQKTLVMSPHGAFNPLQLKHSGWKKAAVGWIDRGLLRRASVVHATCEEEAGWIEAFLGTPRQGESPRRGGAVPRRPKIVVIPNGVEKCVSVIVR